MAENTWRNTASTPRFLIFDYRLAVFMPLFFLHMRIWTLVVLLMAMLFFWALELKGIGFSVALRSIRFQLGALFMFPVHIRHRRLWSRRVDVL